MTGGRGWRVFATIGMLLLVWLVRSAGLLLLLRFGCAAVTDGLMAGDRGVFIRDVLAASVGWVVLHDVRVTIDGRGR
ncbi:hypothetical protein [Bifidobacterium myosotis]|uniref:Uncharacterized protein n=1 Tax=Bifidobacterium myosotis TaxID=1630166 RepID=A0A5M9ZMN5_9BIFI|nr:hypothetical protein [Bifidobacterium myosotis]KAA8828132.1 hypothetical protein EMO91_06740 [Bifidobacterium myosotis]